MLGEVKFGKGAVQPEGAGRREPAHCWVRERAGHLGDKVLAWPSQRLGRAGREKVHVVWAVWAESGFGGKSNKNSRKVSYSS